MVKIFLDTDYGNVYDDIGAIAVLHALADQGEAEIIGMTTCVAHKHSVGALASTNKFFGRENIPLGAYKEDKIYSGINMYCDELVQEFPAKIQSSDDTDDAVTITRKVLSENDDVVYVALGATNNLADLLKSSPDHISPLSGKELVEKAICKLVIMGGSFDNEQTKRTDNPKGVAPGWTYNWSYYAPKDSQYVMDNWPTPIEILTSEAGYIIRTGKSIYSPELPMNPVLRAYEIYKEKQEENKTIDGAWDQLTVLLAVRGYNNCWDIERGTCLVDEQGCSSWKQATDGKHSFGIIKEKFVEEISKECDNLMYQAIAKVKKDMLINPTLACANRLCLGEELDTLKTLGNKIIHIDIMDGHYVPNLCFDMATLKQIKQNYDVIMDVHLMATNPQDYIEDLADAGVEFVSFHLDATSFSIRIARLIQSKGMKVGVALNPSQGVELLEPILEYLDFVLVMAVEPGFSGQNFIQNAYSKIEKLSEIRKERHFNFLIEVDGGVDEVNGKKCIELGADILVAGAFAVFKGDLEQDYKNFREALL